MKDINDASLFYVPVTSMCTKMFLNDLFLQIETMNRVMSSARNEALHEGRKKKHLKAGLFKSPTPSNVFRINSVPDYW